MFMLIITILMYNVSEGGGAHSSVTTINFESKIACEQAMKKYLDANQTSAGSARMGKQVTAVCVARN